MLRHHLRTDRTDRMMASRSTTPLIVCLLLLFTPLPILAEDTRAVWEYASTNGKQWITHIEGKKWVNYLANDSTLVYLEDERTDDYITLLGVGSNQAAWRLNETFAELRRKPGDEWLRWKGAAKWTNREALPPKAKMFKGHEIRVLYFVPSDRTPIPKYEAKIRVVLAYVEEIYRQALRAREHNLKQLPFEREQGEPVVHLVKADKPAAFFNKGWAAYDGTQMRRIADYVKKHVHDPTRRVTLVIPETWEPGPAKDVWPGHVARGANNSPDGGFAVYSAWVLQDRFCASSIQAQRKLFFDARPVVGRRSFFSAADSPVYEFVENGIGGVAHELGHAFGLSHDYRESSVDMMGSGFRNIRFNFDRRAKPNQRVGFSPENTRLLLSSRYLAQDLQVDDYTPPKVDVQVAVSADGRVRASLELSDENGLRALVIRHRRPGSADVVQGRALQGKGVAFETAVDVQIKPETMALWFAVTDNGGNIAQAIVPSRDFVRQP